MAQPWTVLASLPTPEGALELRQRGPKDFVIVVGGRVLMSSTAFRSELAVAELACKPLAAAKQPRVLIGGLGMGYTLRAALDALPPSAEVTVAELNAQVVQWCQGPLALLTGDALADPRTRLHVGDVAALIGRERARWDAIVLDLYEGPHAASQKPDDPFWGRSALLRTHAALAPGGILTVWAEDFDPPFVKRLESCGFAAIEVHHPGKGGRRHTVYVARRRGGPVAP
ncbi:MAG: spermidine synthase [Deltaproteobacteria bacterium]|nr:spermidine synthase [Deltaproteobacteria bacterium]